MAIQSVQIMVKNRLAYLTVAQDTIIDQFRVEACYLLQTESEKADADVETEAGYKPLFNMLFADMVAYWLVKRKVIQNLAGDGTTSGTAAKTLKKAKADVVEAEFVVVKASDGALIQMETTEFLLDLLKDICAKSLALDIFNPLCYDPEAYNVIPAFIKGADYPAGTIDNTDILNGSPLG